MTSTGTVASVVCADSAAAMRRQRRGDAPLAQDRRVKPGRQRA
jgi:hypothetical protein